MNIQFAHLNPPEKDSRFTIAVAVPSKVELLNYLDSILEDEISDFTMKLGVTKVNPKDQYIKSVGRNLALDRIKDTEFVFQSVSQHNGRHRYAFHSVPNQDDLVTSVILTTVPYSENVKLENVYVF